MRPTRIRDKSMKKLSLIMVCFLCIVFYTSAQTNYFLHSFSVSPSQTVLFSQANLNMDKGTNKQFFENHQVRCLRSANVQTIMSKSGKIDLFLGVPQEKQRKAFASLDDEGWRTLTDLEWDYLLNKRITVSGARYLKVYIASTLGMLIFPDDFECPGDISINVDNINNENPDAIQHFGTEWYSLEKKGVVFLPAAGHVSISGEPRYLDENEGYYWIDDKTVFCFSNNKQGTYGSYLHLNSYRLVKNNSISPLTSTVSDYHLWNNAKSTNMQPANINQSRGAEGTFIFSDKEERKIKIKLYKDRNSYNQHQFTFAINGQDIPCTGDWGSVGFGSDYYVWVHLNVSSVVVINSSGETKPLANIFLKGDYVYFNSKDAQNETGLRFKLYRVK